MATTCSPTKYSTADVPLDDSLEEMQNVLSDPERLPILLRIAKQCYCTENVDFLLACMAYEGEVTNFLVEHSQSIHGPIQEHTKNLYEKYIRPNCALEVNEEKLNYDSVETVKSIQSKATN